MDKWLTLKEAEQLTGVKHNTFGSYITRNKVIPENKRIKKGNMWLIDREWLEEKYKDKIKERETMTNLVLIKDDQGRDVYVNINDRKIYDYSNKENWIEYNARIYRDGEPTMFFTNYREAGKVLEVKDRMETWNNAAKLGFAIASADLNKNDKEVAWQGLIEHIKKNEEQYFDSNGDWKLDLKVTAADIKAILKL